MGASLDFDMNIAAFRSAYGVTRFALVAHSQQRSRRWPDDEDFADSKLTDSFLTDDFDVELVPTLNKGRPLQEDEAEE